MMATLYIEPIHESGEILRLVRSAIESEVAKLELALQMAVKRLVPFEEKYGVTTYFTQIKRIIEQYAAISFVLEVQMHFELRPGHETRIHLG
jgi:hypothetical protein